MAIDLTLYMHTDANANELLVECRRALATFGLPEPTLELSEARVDPLRNEILREAHQLSATTGLLFHLNLRGDVAAQMHAVLGASLRVLERFSGDAVLIYNGDVAYFLRRDGNLFLNARDTLWGPERLALVPGAFTRAELPDL